MSATVTSQTGNQLFVDYDYSKLFIYNNRYEKGTFINAGGGALDFAPGTLLGRITASGKLIPLASGAADGSEIPVGILKTGITQLGAGLETEVNYCLSGDVVESAIIFDGGDDLDTVVDGRPLRDRIAADTMGIKLIESDEMTAHDNS